MEKPFPFYLIIDEAQEIATGMQIESMLAGGAKFGARMFVLTQSLSMMRQIEGFEPVVQALLANTSTQAFFSVGSEDAEIVHQTLNTTSRFGISTLDLRTLQCWLRARVDGQWQSPTLIKVLPLRRPNPDDVQKLIREVIAAHPSDYLIPSESEENMVGALIGMIPKSEQGLLSITLAADIAAEKVPSDLDKDKKSVQFIYQEDIPESIARRGKYFATVLKKEEVKDEK